MIIDPYRSFTGDPVGFANVVLLLHGDGADLSTSIIDSSASTKTLTAYDGAKLTTSIYKYGTSSLDFSGTNYRILAGNDPSFNVGSGDFSIEMFVRIQNGDETPDRVIWCKDQIGGTRGILLYTKEATGQLGFACWHSSGGTNSVVETAYNFRSLSVGVWAHVAGVRDGNNIYLYVDGVSVGSADITGKSIGAPSEPVVMGVAWGVGTYIANTSALCYLDEVRFIVGQCIYPGGATFTPPSGAFPDS